MAAFDQMRSFALTANPDRYFEAPMNQVPNDDISQRKRSPALGSAFRNDMLSPYLSAMLLTIESPSPLPLPPDSGTR